MVPKSMGEGVPDTPGHLARLKSLKTVTYTRYNLQKYMSTSHNACLQRGYTGIRDLALPETTMRKITLSRIVQSAENVEFTAFLQSLLFRRRENVIKHQLSACFSILFATFSSSALSASDILALTSVCCFVA